MVKFNKTKRIVFWILHILTVMGLVFSFILIAAGNRPCSGDGCMVQFLYIIGTPLLIIFVILFFFMTRTIIKQWKSRIQ